MYNRRNNTTNTNTTNSCSTGLENNNNSSSSSSSIHNNANITTNNNNGLSDDSTGSGTSTTSYPLTVTAITMNDSSKNNSSTNGLSVSVPGKRVKKSTTESSTTTTKTTTTSAGLPRRQKRQPSTNNITTFLSKWIRTIISTGNPRRSNSIQSWNGGGSKIRRQRPPHSYDMMIAITTTFVCTFMGAITVLRLLTTGNSNLSSSIRRLLTVPSISRNLQHNGGKDTDLNLSEEDQIRVSLGLEELPFNPIYTIPESMKIVGDRSDEYIKLRQLYDNQVLPKNDARSLQYTQELTTNNRYSHIPVVPIPSLAEQQAPAQSPSNTTTTTTTTSSADSSDSDTETQPSTVIPYDINNCPPEPPVGYPYQWNLLSIITNWQPDDIEPPSQIYQALCVFDYGKDYDKAMAYRTAELPFIIINDPQVARTVERWNSPNYLEQMLNDNILHRTEYSTNNHFMYYVPVSKKRKNRLPNGRYRVEAPQGWKEPTKMMKMSYSNWLRHANVTEPVQPNEPHWYYRLIGCGAMGNEGTCDRGSSEYLFDELPFFQPSSRNLYIVQPEEQKGIHCRFGMMGVIAENHFDASRNAIVILGGARRYILTHPNQCDKLALYPKQHPSARHSAVDWSHPDLQQFPQFASATANEVILLPGQVLYLPTDWFHFIVSLELNYQCNTRSGVTHHYTQHIHRCGF